MKSLRVLLPLLMLSTGAFGQAVKPSPHQTVDIPSGDLHLTGFLWQPAGAGPFPAVSFIHGSGETDTARTAGMQMTEAAETLAPVFLKHGYAFLYEFRRGQGPSVGQGDALQDLLRREELAHGKEARQALQFRLMNTDQIADAAAAISFLKNSREIDASRIAIVGHSFGGQLALLIAGSDSSVRAAVTFGAAAYSWQHSSPLREQLTAIVRATSVPIMLIHAANDYDTSAGRALAGELDKSHKNSILKIYPPFGHSQDDGHNIVYQAIPLWEADVFNFLDKHVKH